jgi:hypothetical protein
MAEIVPHMTHEAGISLSFFSIFKKRSARMVP